MFFSLPLLLLPFAAAKLVFRENGEFKILHLSDIHFEPHAPVSCEDILESQLPCGPQNTTDFIQWLMETEKPDLVVHTGDIIDWGTYPAKEGMDILYGLSYANNIPWAASLGNHDDDSKSMQNRTKVIEYVVGLPGSLSQLGDVSDSLGNFVLELFARASDAAPVMRTFHLDSDNAHDYSISEAQVQWFADQAAKLNQIAAVPSLAFYHVPLVEYQTAMDAGLPFSGNYGEAICFQPENTDHTNTFAVEYEGVQLVYEGSAGYQGYSSKGFARQTRVTVIGDFGKTVTSWKRLDNSIGGGALVDREVLWKEGETLSFPSRKSVSKEFGKTLPKRSQPERR